MVERVIDSIPKQEMLREFSWLYEILGNIGVTTRKMAIMFERV